MCGLVGILESGGRSSMPLTDRVTRMADTLVHRGPDDSGAFADPVHGVALGFRRLAIVDLSPGGHQPMNSGSGRYTIVFNGEIYNFRQLASDLRNEGCSFHGTSDTEVALVAIEQWGMERALRAFNGMFAIALWDAEQKELTLARDRVGKKPLFIFRTASLLLFASELKALCADHAFPRAVDTAAVAAYMRYMYVPSPYSIYRDVEKLRPGHMLTVTASSLKTSLQRAYWTLPAPSPSAATAARAGDLADDVNETFAELLQDAVKLRMHADVPLGALLSGGLDSTLVVSTMANLSSRPIQTFSIGFDSPEHDEASYAREIASYLGTEHTELYVDGRAAMDVVPDLADIYDEPLADPSGIPTLLVSRLARQHVTVALTGDGGDELFAGYHRYITGAPMIDRAGKVPRMVRSAFGSTLTAVPAGVLRATEMLSPGAPRLLREKVRKLGTLLRQPNAAHMYRSLLSVWQNPSWILADAQNMKLYDELDWRDEAGVLRAMMYADQREYLPDDLLAKLDRASMFVSLEARAPLLDYRIIEFASQLPPEALIAGSLGKQPIRHLLRSSVPAHLWERPKMGFTVPIDAWLRGPLKQYAGDLLLPECVRRVGLLDPAAAGRSWNRFIGGREHNALGIWTAVTLQAWGLRWLSPVPQSSAA